MTALCYFGTSLMIVMIRFAVNQQLLQTNGVDSLAMHPGICRLCHMYEHMTQCREMYEPCGLGLMFASSIIFAFTAVLLALI